MNIGSDKEYALRGYTIESLLELAYRLGRNSVSSGIDVKDMLKCAEYVIECPEYKGYAASSNDLESLPDWIVCKECYPTKLLNDVIRMDYRKRYSRMGSKSSL